MVVNDAPNRPGLVAWDSIRRRGSNLRCIYRVSHLMKDVTCYHVLLAQGDGAYEAARTKMWPRVPHVAINDYKNEPSMPFRMSPKLKK